MRIALAAALALCAGQATACDTVAGREAGACFAEPTDRYDHGVLGDGIEWGALRVMRPATQSGAAPGWTVFRLPETLVFEDLAPRRVALDGGGAYFVVVESDVDRGARVAVWDAAGRVAATPFIGTRHRWLAPVGAADLDGDGRVEIAYVETPHRDKVLKVVRLDGGRLVPVARMAGLTNHRIGDAFIQGGIADCGDGPVILTADAGWTRIMATRLEGGRLISSPVGSYLGPASLSQELACG